jgi:hypothetical protein
MLHGDASREKILRRCSAAKSVRHEYASDVEQGVDTLASDFSYDAAQMGRLFQEYLDNSRQFGSVKELYSNYPR